MITFWSADLMGLHSDVIFCTYLLSTGEALCFVIQKVVGFLRGGAEANIDCPGFSKYVRCYISSFKQPKKLNKQNKKNMFYLKIF